MPSIRLSYETKDPESGYLKTIAQRGFDDVERQVREVLREVKYDDESNAEQVAEWFSWNRDIHSQEFPARVDPVAFMERGNSEGYIVRIACGMRDENDTYFYKPFLAIKYLTDSDFAYRVAQKVNEALYDGLFTSQLDLEADAAAYAALTQKSA